MNTKTETWNGNEIRFVEKEPGEWWAVAQDISCALDYSHTPHMLRMLKDKHKGVHKVDSTSGKAKSRRHQDMAIISEIGIYQAIFSSQKPYADEFQEWVYGVIRELRIAAGLESFEVLLMTDPTRQRDIMQHLHDGLAKPTQKDYIKANTIANKAVSNRHGIPKMLKKEQMTPEMLLERQPILEDTVNLMTAIDSFGLGLSVSKAVYAKYCN